MGRSEPIGTIWRGTNSFCELLPTFVHQYGRWRNARKRHHTTMYRHGEINQAGHRAFLLSLLHLRLHWRSVWRGNAVFSYRMVVCSFRASRYIQRLQEPLLLSTSVPKYSTCSLMSLPAFSPSPSASASRIGRCIEARVSGSISEASTLMSVRASICSDFQTSCSTLFPEASTVKRRNAPSCRTSSRRSPFSASL